MAKILTYDEAYEAWLEVTHSLAVLVDMCPLDTPEDGRGYVLRASLRHILGLVESLNPQKTPNLEGVMMQ